MASPPDPLRTTAVAAGCTVLSAVLLWHGTGLRPAAWLTWIAAAPIVGYAVRAGAPAAAVTAFAAWAGGGLNLWHYYRTTLGVPLPIVLVAVALPAVAFSGSRTDRAAWA